MKCVKCEREIIDGSITCPYCSAKQSYPSDEANKLTYKICHSSLIICFILSVLFPFAGLIYSLTGFNNKDFHPYDKAKQWFFSGIIVSAVSLLVKSILLITLLAILL